ncbi:MAG: hypothetical protein ACRD1P_02895 [Thermoanaerobaculia bacterium]
MKKTCLVIVGLTAALLLVLASAPSAAAEKGRILDGKSFVGECGEKGKTAGEKEEIHFFNGKFRSVACDPHGFGDAPYTVMPSGGGIGWTAETTSEKEGKMQWKGTVKGDTLTGTFVWMRAGRAPIEYWVKGTLKK